MIPFNKPFFTGEEIKFIQNAVENGHISGNGKYTKLCHQYFEIEYFKNTKVKALLTSSGTDALEMCAILADIKTGDEVIVPSYTFVSTANSFVLRGAKVVFADSMDIHPNIDADKIEDLITQKTKAIVVVHYAGIACNMSKIMEVANKYNLYVIEDAAHSIFSYYNNIPLGSIGTFGAFSFHETKNIISGEGGLLIVNKEEYFNRAEIIWEKGTNRAQFFRGLVNKYGWVDIGSSFLPSDIIAAILWSQIRFSKEIQTKRIKLWKRYYSNLAEFKNKMYFELPYIFDYSTNNAHMFYIICNSLEDRTNLISYLKEKGIMAVFHYLPLHKSEYYIKKHDGRLLPNSEKFGDRLLRLPLYYELKEDTVDYICECVINFFRRK